MILLNILGTVLKIIGIALLAVILLLLALLLILLLVPLRYRVKVRKEGERLEVGAEVSYLLHLIRLPVAYRDKKLSYSLKILWFTLISSDKPGKRRSKKKPEPEERPEPDVLEESGPEPEPESANEHEMSGDRANMETPEETGSTDALQNAESADNTERAEGTGAAVNTQPADVYDENGNPESEPVLPEQENAEAQEHGRAEGAETKPENIFEKLWKKLSGILEMIRQKVQALADKITAVFISIRGLLKKIISAVRQGGEKLGCIREFLRDEVNKNGIKYSGKTIFKLLKHVLPYKMEGEIIFGTGDPYSMGQALALLGMFYSVYAKRLKVEADFETESFRLDAGISLKGRIRLGSMLLMLIKLWFGGELKKVLNNVKILKDRLTEPAGEK